MLVRLPPPPAEADEALRAVQKIENVFRGRKLKLSERKRKRIDARVRRMLEEHEQKTSKLRAELRELNEFFEGKHEDVDYPFGAGKSSSIDIRMAASRARIMRASIVRAVFSDPRVYVGIPGPGASRDAQLNEIEAAVNWTAEYETNLNETLKDSIFPIYRDGTALVHGSWERRIERGCDYKTYTKAEDFRADYPSAEETGLDEEGYDNILAALSEPDAEVQVEYELDFVSFNGPRFTLCPLAKFIWYPLYPQEMSRLNLYGFYFLETKGEYQMRLKHGFYEDEDGAKDKDGERVMGSYPDRTLDVWDTSREELEGITSSGSESVHSQPLRRAFLVYSDDLDNDGITERYVIYWDMEKNRALRIENYTVRRNIGCMVPLRFIRRDGRFLGISLLKDLEHLLRELNALHRHRSNKRRISDQITLMLPAGLKDRVDLGAEYDQFDPGNTLWIPDEMWMAGKLPQQLALQDYSASQNSADEEALIQRYSDMLAGTSEGQSGRESTIDPNAPASKTAMLLQRSDLRIEDFIDELKRTVPDLVDLLRALFFQNAGHALKYMGRVQGELTPKELPVAILADPGIRMALRPMKPTTSPEFEMNRIAAIVQAAAQMQVSQLKPQMMAELWNEFVSASRIERPERFQIELQAPAAPGTPPGMAMGGSPLQPGQLDAMMGAVASRGNGGAGNSLPLDAIAAALKNGGGQ